jgi:hypothetical protein
MLEQPGKTTNTEELDDGFEVDVGTAGVVVDDLLLAGKRPPKSSLSVPARVSG